MGMGQDLSPRRDHRSEYIIYIYLYLYIYLLRFFSKSFICKRPFFANKKPYFRESFANPMFISRGNLMLKSFAKSFAKKNLSRTKKKLSRGLMLKPGGLGN